MCSYQQKIVVIAAVFLWNCYAAAQIITGVVYDKATKMPVSSVYVTLVGTSIHAVTYLSGTFELKTDSVSNTGMMLRHVSYHPVMIDSPFDRLPDTLYVEERINRISEVTVASRRRKIKKRTVVIEYIIGKNDSVSSVKLIRSSGYPSIDATALQYPYYVLKRNHKLPREKPIRKKQTFRFDINNPPTFRFFP